MSTEDGSGQSAGVTASAPLPELSDERIDEIEAAVFAGISRERTKKRVRRGRWLIGGAAAAAVIVVAAVIAPSMSGLLGGAGGASDSADYAVAPEAPAVAPDMGGGSDSSGISEGATTEDSSRSEADASALQSADGATADRDIITNASATVVVNDIPAAAETIAEAAEARDGYVESMSIGQSGEVYYPVDPDTGVMYDDTRPYPYPPSNAWITVRVPSNELSGMVRELSALGEVTASTVNRQDVTEQVVDLEARIEASQASVDRLIELMAQATSVADLIAAESALAERQATLESYQAQLKSLQSAVEMSSLTVTLEAVTEPVEADPAGFTDGLIAGWNGLVATLNGIVIALGFLLPWLLVIAIAGLIVWAIVRTVRRRRAARADAARAAAAPAGPIAPTPADGSPPPAAEAREDAQP
jgi:hypothetical protein